MSPSVGIAKTQATNTPTTPLALVTGGADSFPFLPYYLWQADAAGTGPQNPQGLFVGKNNNGTETLVGGSDVIPPSWQVSTAAVASTVGVGINLAGNIATTGLGLPAQFWRKAIFKISLQQINNMRIWVGLGEGQAVGGSGWSSNAPNFNFVGFRYNGNTESRYHCILQTSGAPGNPNQSDVSAPGAIGIDTNPHILGLAWDGVNINFVIDGQVVVRNNVNLPGTGIGLTPIVIIDNLNLANAVSFRLFMMAGLGKGIGPN